MNEKLAVENMIEQQIRPWNVLSPEVLNVFKKVKRGDFTDQSDLAYADIYLPILDGEVMLEPKIEARILQALDIDSKDNILEIGTGSGHMSALLAILGNSVDTLEINPKIAEIAKLRLSDHNNVNIIVSDIFADPIKGNYNIIVLTGALEVVPESVMYALREGGRLFSFIRQSDDIVVAKLMHRLSGRQWSEEIVFETNIPDLRNIPKQPQDFIF